MGLRVMKQQLTAACPGRQLIRFIEDGDKFLPYFIEKLQSTIPYQSIIKFEELRTREDVLKLGKRKLFIPASALQEFFEESKDTYLKLTGYNAIDLEYGQLGEIEEVVEMPAQHVAIVAHESGQEIMIPLVDENIESVDDEQKEVKFKLPAGLIALYLE